MDFISEDKIEGVLELLESRENGIEEGFTELSNEQPAVIQFLASENFKILKENEYDVLVFILVVIYKSCKSDKDLSEISAQLIESKDEHNWEVYNEKGSQNYTKALDIYFKNYPQEDLLAFVEDTLIDDDDQTISAVGKEIIFISAKTFLDCLHNSV